VEEETNVNFRETHKIILFYNRKHIYSIKLVRSNMIPSKIDKCAKFNNSIQVIFFNCVYGNETLIQKESRNIKQKC
jgi:hypothetical protein